MSDLASTENVVALIAERDALKVKVGNLEEANSHLHVLLSHHEVAKATARALAMADAANAIVSSMVQVETGLTIRTLGATADMIRALAPMPPGLVAVDAKVMKEWHHAAAHHSFAVDEAGRLKFVADGIRAALGAEVKP